MNTLEILTLLLVIFAALTYLDILAVSLFDRQYNLPEIDFVCKNFFELYKKERRKEWDSAVVGIVCNVYNSPSYGTVNSVAIAEWGVMRISTMLFYFWKLPFP